MKQESFSDMEYRCRKKKTKREEFLEIMDEIIPWEEWVSLVVPHYPTGKRGRPPIEIETMLRMYLLQCWFSLSDEGVEDAIYDSYAMRKFMGINFFEQDVPDATTLLHFRHLLEEKGIGKLFFDAVNRCLEGAGRMMRGGSIVDATLISAPSSTKNAEKKRDPEMHSVKKGNQWHFGMKCHTGVDTRVLYVASATSTWIDGYTTKVYSTDAPAGTIFTAENGSPLETVQENGAACYKVDTSRNRSTNLNSNGSEYYGAFKVCVPVNNTADEGSFTIRAIGGVAQFIAIQEIIKEYQRQKTNQRSRKGGSARKPQQYHAEAEVII